MKLYYHDGKMITKEEKIEEMKKQEIYGEVYGDDHLLDDKSNWLKLHLIQ